MGVITAPATKVAVMAHDASVVEAFKNLGSSGINGMIRVCISETTIPQKAKVVTTILGVGVRTGFLLLNTGLLME